MNQAMPRDPELQRMQTAADWLISLRDAPDDEALVAAWLQWCEEDPRNLEEFRSAQSVWHAAIPAPTAARAQTGRPTSRLSSVRAWQQRWLPARVAVALAAALVLAIGIGWTGFDQSIDRTSQSYATAVGGTGSTVLPDGSRVDLGADSRITILYTPDRRQVSVDFGEAYFSVAKNPARPFLVAVGDMQVTAVGTAFNVRRQPGRVVVAVSEGRVKLDNRERRGRSGELHEIPSTPLSAGQQAVYSGTSRSIEVASIHLADVASWRRGVLKYVHEPLGNVVLDLNRYYSKRIVITDERLSQMPFTGAVFSTRIDDALRALEGAFPLQVQEYADRIELSPRG
jgi:transmembrane sensor